MHRSFATSAIHPSIHPSRQPGRESGTVEIVDDRVHRTGCCWLVLPVHITGLMCHQSCQVFSGRTNKVPSVQYLEQEKNSPLNMIQQITNTKMVLFWFFPRLLISFQLFRLTYGFNRNNVVLWFKVFKDVSLINRGMSVPSHMFPAWKAPPTS